jgi:segregation and condensation protein B
MTLAQSIVAILFFRGEPVPLQDLATELQVDIGTIQELLASVHALVEPTGLAIIETDSTIELRTGVAASALIERIRKDELSKDLGKAALETLSILLYKGPSTRAEVDYIRGVNSTAILRNLMIRGLIDKEQHPSDQRSFVYKPTVDLLAHMGISRLQDLPSYADIQHELATFENSDSKATNPV